MLQSYDLFLQYLLPNNHLMHCFHRLSHEHCPQVLIANLFVPLVVSVKLHSLPELAEAVLQPRMLGAVSYTHLTLPTILRV